MLLYPYTHFFLTGGDPHSGDGNLGDRDGEGDRDLGVRDLKGDFLSWILTPSLSCSSFCFLLPHSPSLMLLYPYTHFFLTGGDPHSGDGNIGDRDGEGDRDLGVRDLKSDFLSWILTPLMLLLLPSSSSLLLPLYFLPLDIL